jgi:hypothetical protein
MSITPYNNYTVKDLTGIKQPYVNSTTEFGYFGNLGYIGNYDWYSMPTVLLTNNGIATVDASGLHILQAGIYTLNLSVDCVKAAPIPGNEAIYFNFGTNYLYLTNPANLSGSFGLIHTTGMLSFGSNATSYPGIISCLTNAISGTNTFASRYLDPASGSQQIPVTTRMDNQLVYYYVYNNNTTAGGAAVPMPPGICTTEITFIINQPTTIYFNIGGNAYLQMGTSYFTLELISIISPNSWNWRQTSASITNWQSIASDSTGQYLAAVVSNGGGVTSGGGIYKSSNSGSTWTPTSAPTRNWQSISSSSNGTHLAAVISNSVSGSGGIYYSNNSGGSWTKSNAIEDLWTCIASDSTGQYLSATVYAGGIYTSTTFGQSWTIRYNAPNNNYWTGIASSSDGTKLAAIQSNLGEGIPGTSYIYTSTDPSHNIWTQTDASSNSWQAIASDSTGQYLAAVSSTGTSGQIGSIYTSSDPSHNIWTKQTVDLPPNAYWQSITSSSDGSRLAAVSLGSGTGKIYTSLNYGSTWTLQTLGLPANANWQSIASSSDGAQFAAVISGGGIYTSELTY